MNQRIKYLRKSIDLTQAGFAERIGLKQNTIALIESGKRCPSDQAILSICREYGISEHWLRTGEGEMYPPKPKPAGLDELLEGKKISPLEREIIEGYFSLPDEARAAVMDWITAKVSAAQLPPAPDPIEAEVESYRQELEAVAKGAVKSSPSAATDAV